MSEFARAFDDTLPVLPAGLLGRVGNRVEPYIYSDEDISLLMYAASQMSSLDPLRPLANKTLIGLLRATGMRPSEAVNLKDMDIDEDKGTIVVKDSKGKSRILPILESTLTALISYRGLRDQLRSSFSCDNLLISSGGIPLTLDAAR
jgi:integrase